MAGLLNICTLLLLFPSPTVSYHSLQKLALLFRGPEVTHCPLTMGLHAVRAFKPVSPLHLFNDPGIYLYHVSMLHFHFPTQFEILRNKQHMIRVSTAQYFSQFGRSSIFLDTCTTKKAKSRSNHTSYFLEVSSEIKRNNQLLWRSGLPLPYLDFITFIR